MSQIIEQIKELRQYASERKGEIADICNRAADTIEVLSERLRTSRYSDDEIQKMQDLEQAEIEKAYELGKAEGQKSEDAISRQAVLDGLASIAKVKARSDAQKSLMGRVMFFVEQLPLVTPQPKTGHWIVTEDGFECSECGCISRSRADFCQYCGAKMVEPQESEEV